MIDLGSLVLVSGKGGVGKSAVTAAIAIAGQRSGARVLAIATESGSGLSSHLGGIPLEFEPTEITDGLSALRIDRSKALAEYLQLQAGVPPLIAFGPALRAFDALALAAPGVREIVTIGKILWEVRRHTWDLVVVDAPPTGQVASYLRAPGTITELVPAGRIREQAAWMGEILRNADQTSLLLTTLAEELPTAETCEALDWLGEERVVDRVAIVTNRLLPDLGFPADTLPSGRAGDAARLHVSLYREQQRWLETLPPDHRLPFLFGLMTPAEVAARLADELERWKPAG